MSVTRTFTVTVQSTGSGNKYFIDGVQQDTLTLGETGTYKFDQSDSSNSNHPLRFSTTSNGTHNGGSEYTTGVTTNGTPGQAGAYTQIVVATSAPTLYYYCTAHSGMGGQANTVDPDTYGIFDWGKNTWGSQSGIDVSLTGVNLTSSVGTISPADVMGLTGLSSTASPGVLSVVSSSNFTLTGVNSISSVGSVNIADMVVGLTGLGTTSSVGSIAPADVVGLTGVLATSAFGEVTTSGAAVINLTGLSTTSSVGTITPPNQAIGLTGVSSTSTTGSVVVNEGMGLTGVSATSSVNGVGLILKYYEILGPKTNTTGYTVRTPE